jgi:hypothetical protein
MLGCAILILTGCSKDGPAVKLAPARGRVVSVGDAKARGPISFVPDVKDGNAGMPAEGTIAEDGTFSVETYPHGKGAIPGSYKVILAGGAGKKAQKYKKYTTAGTTPWAVEIPETGKTDIELKFIDD